MSIITRLEPQNCQPLVHMFLGQHLLKIHDCLYVSKRAAIVSMTEYPTVHVHMEENSSIALATLELTFQQQVGVILLPK